MAKYRATINENVIKGMEILLENFSLPGILIDKIEVKSAIRYMRKQINLYYSPEAVERRQKVLDTKAKWTEKQISAGLRPPLGRPGRKLGSKNKPKGAQL